MQGRGQDQRELLDAESGSPRHAEPGSADAAVGIDLLTDETSHVEVPGDSGYATRQALATLAETGHTPLVKPWPVQLAVPGGFTITDFTIDTAGGVVAALPHRTSSR